jgi:phosphoribosylformylglycinamidine cyclo-ligase
MDDSGASKYAQAGVDLERAGEVTKRIGELARSTFNDRVLKGIGTFGALYDLRGVAGDDTVLVSSVDGVGTKLRIAFLAGRHDTVGRDLVNHCVNDILTMGAQPLFFMDYVAVGKIEGRVVEEIVLGLREACRENGIPLIGGETAEMPGFYRTGEYDLVGFIVGAVPRGGLYDGSRIREGDRVLGLLSNGLHTNGYSLVRRVLVAEDDPDSLRETVPGTSVTLEDELLRVHRSYRDAVSPLLGCDGLHGMAHITGGGIVENLPRILPGMVNARIDTRAWTPPPIFACLQEQGGISRDEMFRVFNMGLGFLLVVDPAEAESIAGRLEQAGETVVPAGAIVPGNGQVELIA